MASTSDSYEPGSGRVPAPREIPGWLRPEQLVFTIVSVLMALMILAPLVMLLYGSFTDERFGAFDLSPTVQNYVSAFTSSRYFEAFLNTAFISVATTLFGGGFGLFLAWVVVRTDIPYASGLRLGLMAPFFLAPIIGALAWIALTGNGAGPISRLFMAVGLPAVDLQNVSGIIFIMSLYYAPYTFIFVSAALENLDSSVEEAGAMSGLNRWQVMRSVTLPLVGPAVLSGLVLTFISAMGQFGVPALLGTPINYWVLTTHIFDLAQTYPTNFNLAATLAIFLLVVCAGIIWIQRKVLANRSYTTMSGKGGQNRPVPLGRLRWVFVVLVGGYILLTAVLPVLMLVYISLVPLYTGAIDLSHLTLRNYVDAFTINQAVQRAIRNTILLAGGGALIGVIVGFIISYITIRTRLWYRHSIDYIIMLPAAVPSVVYGIAMLWTYVFVPLPIYGTLWLLLIGYVVGFIPFAYRAVHSSLSQIDVSLEEAATMVGASWWRRMWSVTIPLSRSGMVAGWVILFTIFVRELAISVFLYAPGSEVLPVIVYNKYQEGQYPQLAALAVIQIAFIAFAVIVVSRVFRVDVTRTT